MKKIILTIALTVLGANGYAAANSVLKAECKVICTGPVCGGKLIAEFETDKNTTIPLKAPFAGITFTVNLDHRSSSMGSEEMDSVDAFFTRGNYPNIEILGSTKTLIDLDSLASGGRVLIRADWMKGEKIGNLAGQCLITKL